MRARRDGRTNRARLPIVKPIQGGRNGLINAIMACRIDPLSANPEDGELFRHYGGSDLRAIELRKRRKAKRDAKRRAEACPF